MAETEQPAQPTAEQVQKATEVSAAAAAAAQGASSEDEARERARAAIDRKADEVQLKLSDEDKNEIVDMFIERLNALGAFDAPPAPTPAPAPAAGVETSSPSEVEAPAVPQRKTFAERYAGL